MAATDVVEESFGGGLDPLQPTGRPRAGWRCCRLGVRSLRWSLNSESYYSPNDAARPDKHFRAYADAEQFANAEVNSGRADRASIYEHGANNRLVRVITPKVSEA